MKVIIGSDHAGFELKERVKKFLLKKNYEVEDAGTYNLDSVDYPDYAYKVARKVSKNKNVKGILICGTGTGMVIAANRIKGVRASVIYDKYSAVMAREHNDANVACLRGRKFGALRQIKLLWVWLNTKFSENTRHKRRIRKLR